MLGSCAKRPGQRQLISISWRDALLPKHQSHSWQFLRLIYKSTATAKFLTMVLMDENGSELPHGSYLDMRMKVPGEGNPQSGFGLSDGAEASTSSPTPGTLDIRTLLDGVKIASPIRQHKGRSEGTSMMPLGLTQPTPTHRRILVSQLRRERSQGDCGFHHYKLQLP
jgi:hypothetical protein